MILTAIALGMAFGGCSKYDDSALWKSVNDLDERLTALEKSVAQMNGDIRAIDALVATLEKGGMITDVKQTDEGYEITVSNSDTPIVVRNGENGAPGGDAPVIGVRKDTDGRYYWTMTVNGTESWLPDEEHKLPVTGADGAAGAPGTTPVMGVDTEGYWTVDYGDGPRRIPGDIKATGTAGDSFFADLDESDEHYVVLRLKSGEQLVLPRNNATLAFVATPDGIPPHAYYGGSVTLPVTLRNIEFAELLSVPAGWSGSFDPQNASVTLQAPAEWSADTATEGKVSLIGLAANGQTLIAYQPVYVVDFTHPEGTFVVTEGNMGSQNGTVFYFDQYMQAHPSVYEKANEGRTPGNVLQDMWLAGDRAVFLCQNGKGNGGDGQVVVCNAHTLKLEKAYDDLVFNRPEGSNNVGCPQHLAVVGDKAFIQYVDIALETNAGIRVFDLATGTLSSEDIEGSYGAFASEGALKGRMWVSRGMVVAGLAKAVLFIDPATGNILHRTDFGGQVKGIVKGADGNFHVAVSGDFEGAPSYGAPTPDGSRIVGLDHEGNILYTYDLPDGVRFPIATWQPSVSMCASFTQPYLYLVTGEEFSATSASRFNYETRTLTQEFVTLSGYNSIAGYMGVHPTSERLLVGQSVAYSSSSIGIFDPDAPAEPLAVFDYDEATPAGVDFAYRFSETFIAK